MKPFQNELDIAIDVTRQAISELAKIPHDEVRFNYAETLPREMKAEIDNLLEKIILKRLLPTGIPVLSEEKGVTGDIGDNELRWVVDPLDGTVNFIRNMAPCSVSIALCIGETPILGVIGEYPSQKIAWGGEIFGSFLNNKKLRVSNIKDKSKAVICTGFPSRYEFSETNKEQFFSKISPFGKVRMFGAASLSLLQVAKGATDAYFENEIMIWDVAAGLALVKGSGGIHSIKPGHFKNSFNVFASNGFIMDETSNQN